MTTYTDHTLSSPCPNFPAPVNQQVQLSLIFLSYFLSVLPPNHKSRLKKKQIGFYTKHSFNPYSKLVSNNSHLTLTHFETEAWKLREITQRTGDKISPQTPHSSDSRTRLSPHHDTASFRYFSGFQLGPPPTPLVLSRFQTILYSKSRLIVLKFFNHVTFFLKSLTPYLVIWKCPSYSPIMSNLSPKAGYLLFCGCVFAYLISLA